MNDVTDLEYFDVQMRIWGWSLLHGVGDHSTVIAESRGAQRLDCKHWDYDQDYLDTISVNGEPATPKFALYWGCEHIRRYGFE